jgi:hypothetical protein
VVPNKGSRISIQLSDEKTEINGPLEFFSSNGVYAMENMQIYTTPGLDDLIMTANAEPVAVKLIAGEGQYNINWSLKIRGCGIGEA